MITLVNYFELVLLLNWVDYNIAIAVKDKTPRHIDSNGSIGDLVRLLTPKAYLPNDLYLPKASVFKNMEPDANYILSKLSDEDLLKLLNEQPNKNEYDLNDAIKLASNTKIVLDTSDLKPDKPSSFKFNEFGNQKLINQFQETIPKNLPEGPVFRLDYKPVKPFNVKEGMDSKYAAVQKLKNMMYSRPREQLLVDNDDEKKELLFDVLVAQLKSLCCKKTKTENTFDNKKHKFKSLLNKIIAQNNEDTVNSEYIFLILNDEIRSSSNEELISVDPESLSRNSSVLLLGPITSHLSDDELKLAINRISNELSRPEYLPVLKELTNGVTGNNIGLVKSLITGPETRRYVKPHRCNHQSKLARVYGGPKWIICTGYLNLNSPSLYD